MITVVNKYKVKNQKRDYIVYCGRCSALGNPFPITENRTREEAISEYKIYFDKLVKDKDKEILAQLDLCRTKLTKYGIVELECYCAPKPCHCDVIKDFLENENK